MATKETLKLGWESDPRSPKKLKGAVVKAGGIGLSVVNLDGPLPPGWKTRGVRDQVQVGKHTGGA